MVKNLSSCSSKVRWHLAGTLLEGALANSFMMHLTSHLQDEKTPLRWALIYDKSEEISRLMAEETNINVTDQVAGEYRHLCIAVRMGPGSEQHKFVFPRFD
jgi:hypothetical protein